MKKVMALGVKRFDGTTGRQRPPLDCVNEINDRLKQVNVDADSIISVAFEAEFIHVLYKVEVQ